MTISRLKRGPFGVRYVVCGGCGEGYREHPNAAFWTTGGLTSPGLLYYECPCGRHHEITRYKPAGAGWRRPLVYHREVSCMPAWAVAVQRGDAWLELPPDEKGGFEFEWSHSFGPVVSL